MTAHRFLFYQPDLASGQPRSSLDGSEHHHLSRVLRARTGDEVCVTNGEGLLVRCRLGDVGKSETHFDVVSIIRDTGRPAELVTLAIAAIRREKLAQAVSQCTELGAGAFVVYRSENTPRKGAWPPQLERLRAVAVGAMKQSFRAVLPEVSVVDSIDAVSEMCRKARLSVVGASDAPPVSSRGGRSGSVVLVVGPEAGLSPGERSAICEAGAVEGSVSPARLRSETAAVALAAAFGARD